jgi:hypothetical protein
VSEPQQGEETGKHAKGEEPKWPGGQNDPGKEFDDWLEKSNREAEGT